MTDAELLTAAKELIADPARWTREVPARDRMGHAVSPNYSGAVCWCAMGAACRVAPAPGPYNRLDGHLYSAARQLFSDRVTPGQVNDRFGHAAVMRLYDRAIELAHASAPAEGSA